MRASTICAWVLILAGSGVPQGFKPKAGFVPDAATAIKIAEAVLVPVYGEKQIVSERPFRALLKGNVWFVEGTLHCSESTEKKDDEFCDGGVAAVQVSKVDGRILHMIH